MTNQKNTGERQQKIIVFLLFIVLILASIIIGTFNKINFLEKPPVTKAPDIEPIEAVAPVSTGKIAIIIDDFGYRDDNVSEGFLALDAELTLAVIPGHQNSKVFAAKADQKGYEVIVHMPMESTNETRGEKEYMLTTSMTSNEIESRVEEVISEFPEAVGMNNHQGSKATSDKRIMNILSNVLKRHGKYFIDSRTTSETVAEITMRFRGVHTIRRHVFLDNENKQNKIREQLYKLVDKAESKGLAVGIGHARINTLEVLKQEIPKLKEYGFKFQFASFAVK